MSQKVLQHFNEMSVTPSAVTVTILFNACAKLADDAAMKLGKHVLCRLPTASFDDHILANSAIDMLMKFGEVNNAEHLFQSMKKKSVVTYGAMAQGQ
jgi:pentatricopeptide repeat protein